MRLLSLCLGVCAAFVAQAAELVVNVSSETDFDAALAALTGFDTQPSRETLNGGAHAAYDIRKTGTGKLVFAKNKFLSGWTGNLYVDAGTVEVQVNCETATYGSQYTQALGRQTDFASGGVYVKDGATVMISVDAYTAYSGYDNSGVKRAFHLAGTGVDNAGALCLNAGGNEGGCARAVCPHRMFLDADATVVLRSSLVWESKPVALGGHTLTFKSDSSTLRNFVESMETSGEGHLVFDCLRCGTRNSKSNRWENPSGRNTVTFRNKGLFAFYNSTTDVVAQNWKYIYESTAAEYVESLCKGKSPMSTAYACFPDGFESARDVTIRLTCTGERDVAPSLANAITFNGRVSGSGGYRYDGEVDNTSKYSPTGINFLGADNDFTGPLAILNADLGLGSGSSLPTGAAVTLVNATVQVEDAATARLAFGTLDATNDVSIGRRNDGALVPSSFSVAATRITKSGAGTLLVSADGFAADEVVINGGSVKLAKATEQSHFMGLVAGRSHDFAPFDNPFTSTKSMADYGFTGDGQLRDVCPYVLYTNEVQKTGPDIFYTPHGEDYQATAWRPKFYCRLMTYSGYVWNTSNLPKTVNVICTLNAYTRIKVGDTEYVSSDPVRNQPEALPTHGAPVAPRLERQITIPAGMSRFEIRVYDRYGTKPEKYAADDKNFPNQPKPFCYGNVCTNGLANWDDRHGLMWSEKTTSKDLVDYHPFAGDESGLVFLASDAISGEWAIGALSGSGILDLNGGTLAARRVSGDVRVVNGLLNVTEGQRLTAGVNTLFGTVVDPARVAGMNFGKVSSFESNADPRALYNAKTLNANAVPVLGLDFFYTTQSQMPTVFGRYTYVTYDGYLWNNTDRDQKWTIASTHDGLTRVVIGNQTFESPYQWYTNWEKLGKTWQEGCSALWTDVTLKPGANKFTVYIAAQYTSAPYVGNVAFGAGTNWVDALGLAFDPQNRKTFDMQYFQKFIDAGDGRLLTHRLVESAIGCSYEAVAGAKGAVVDLAGAEAFVKDVTGGAVVSNGLIHLTGSLTMTAAEICDADVCLDGVAFAAGAVVDVSDDAKALRPKTEGWVVARNVVGTTCPTLGPKLAAEKWSIFLDVKNGEVRVCKPGGMMIIMR